MAVLCILSFVWALPFWFISIFLMADHAWPRSSKRIKDNLKFKNGDDSGCLAWAWLIGAICTLPGIIGVLGSLAMPSLFFR